MADFQTFKKSMTQLKRPVSVTVLKRGVISLNKSAQLALGQPDAVELLYDTARRIVGIRAVPTTATHGYPLRSSTGTDSGPFLVSAAAFLNHYDIAVEVSTRWEAATKGDVLMFGLDDPGVPVTSNRAKHPVPGGRHAARPVRP